MLLPRVLLLLALPLALAVSVSGAAEDPRPSKFMVYVGTSTGGGKSQGIYRMELDVKTGKFTEPVVAAKTRGPTFVAIHPSGKYLFACGELADAGKGKRGGAINAFRIEKRGDLTLLNQQPSEGAGPCHVVTDNLGKFAFCANYGGGSCAALPIETDGKLGKALGFAQHKGSSVNKSRQQAPHAHSINLDPANRFAFVADLGLDKVLIYRFDALAGTLTPNDPPAGKVKPGAGPRHFAFHPRGKTAYVINELDSTITTFRYEPEAGKLDPVQTVTTLPEGFKGTNYPAEVVVHPTGKFVYGSNRGHDSIAIFRAAADGKLTPAGHQGKGVKVPRNFAVDPTGTWCIVANQDANTVIAFKIDPTTGALEPTETSVKIPAPMCIRFLPLSREGPQDSAIVD